MTHGRDHQEREQRYPHPKQIGARTDFEAELEDAGRSGGVPHQHVFGANEGRVASAQDLDEGEPMAGGSEVAPTRRAEARERERHRAERKLGRMAAGIDENLRDRREPAVTRPALDGAARAADRKVAGAR